MITIPVALFLALILTACIVAVQAIILVIDHLAYYSEFLVERRIAARTAKSKQSAAGSPSGQ